MRECRPAAGWALGGRAVGWVPPVTAWQLMRKTPARVMRTDSETAREESEGSGG